MTYRTTVASTPMAEMWAAVRRALLTSGGGSIESALVDRLLAEGRRVSGVGSIGTVAQRVAVAV